MLLNFGTNVILVRMLVELMEAPLEEGIHDTSYAG